jgi:hypothetical protein
MRSRTAAQGLLEEILRGGALGEEGRENVHAETVQMTQWQRHSDGDG